LWNTYRFWVTYANLSHWTPRVAGGPQAPPQDPLDRWVLSELSRLVRDVTTALERYDVNGATRPVAGFVDGLSNWYARLSRRRIWEDDPDALSTMYRCLVTLCRLLAPMMPYVAEEMYQNLVKGVDAGAADSVHLSHWPVVDETLIDDRLSADMALARRVTSLGHAARQLVGLKVRQPLAQVVVCTGQAGEPGDLARLQRYILDELNVKALAFVNTPGDLVEVEVRPVARRLGPRLRDRLPLLRQALSDMDQADLAVRLRAGETVAVEVEGQAYPVEAADVELRTRPREGYSTVEDGGYVVAVTTELTPDLLAEGLSRDLVRRIQQLRKDAGLAVSDRIVTYVGDAQPVRGILGRFGEYLCSETLTVDLHVVPAGEWNQVVDGLPDVVFELGEQEVMVALKAVAEAR
jgi:isoleucyl-tRNA synthetase